MQAWEQAAGGSQTGHVDALQGVLGQQTASEASDEPAGGSAFGVHEYHCQVGAQVQVRLRLR